MLLASLTADALLRLCCVSAIGADWDTSAVFVLACGAVVHPAACELCKRGRCALASDALAAVTGGQSVVTAAPATAVGRCGVSVGVLCCAPLKPCKLPTARGATLTATVVPAGLFRVTKVWQGSVAAEAEGGMRLRRCSVTAVSAGWCNWTR